MVLLPCGWKKGRGGAQVRLLPGNDGRPDFWTKRGISLSLFYHSSDTSYFWQKSGWTSAFWHFYVGLAPPPNKKKGGGMCTTYPRSVLGGSFGTVILSDTRKTLSSLPCQLSITFESSKMLDVSLHLSHLNSPPILSLSPLST
jgi:hypothetical protein